MLFIHGAKKGLIFEFGRDPVQLERAQSIVDELNRSGFHAVMHEIVDPDWGPHKAVFAHQDKSLLEALVYISDPFMPRPEHWGPPAKSSTNPSRSRSDAQGALLGYPRYAWEAMNDEGPKSRDIRLPYVFPKEGYPSLPRELEDADRVLRHYPRLFELLKKRRG
jgi:hypothetical protein